MRGLLCTRKGVLQYRRPHTLQRSACLSASQLALWPASAARSARSTICSSVRTIRRYRHSQRSCCLVLSAAVKRGTASLGPAALSLVVLLTSVNCTVAVTLPQQGKLVRLHLMTARLASWTRTLLRSVLSTCRHRGISSGRQYRFCCRAGQRSSELDRKGTLSH